MIYQANIKEKFFSTRNAEERSLRKCHLNSPIVIEILLFFLNVPRPDHLLLKE